MSRLIERAADLLDCTDWEVFVRASDGPSKGLEEKYNKYLETGKPPREVVEFCGRLPRSLREEEEM